MGIMRTTRLWRATRPTPRSAGTKSDAASSEAACLVEPLGDNPRESRTENKACTHVSAVVVSANKLQLERKTFGDVARSAVAGWLILLLLLCSALAVQSAHGRSHHSDRGKGSTQCIVCDFAHGQLIAMDTAPPLACGAPLFTGFVLSANVSLSASLDYCWSPSRAPPIDFSPVVVG